MSAKKSIMAFHYEQVFRLVRPAWGRLTQGCLLGILAACLYSFLFINDEVGALSEHSMSEEKAVYGIKLFGTRVIAWAIVGAILGALREAYSNAPALVRFRLRTMLAVVTLFCLACGWLSVRSSEWQQYEALGKFGVVRLDIEGYSDLEESVRDRTGKYLRSRYYGTIYLRLFAKVEYVSFFSNRVSSEDLSQLKLYKLSGLRGISFAGTGVTDEILATVASLTELEELALENTTVSDIGIEFLMGVKTLRKISLTNTSVTASGIQKLQEALPECRIIH